MWLALLRWLGAGVLSSGVDAYKAKLAAGNSEDKIAADLAARELAVQQREIEVDAQVRIAQIGKWYEPEHLIGYALAIYFAKCVVWDKVLGLGTTDPLTGAVNSWAQLVIMFYFGKRGIENVARILKR